MEEPVGQSSQSPLAAALETVGRLEEQLRQAQKLESLGLLAGGIAHDFNNLLTVINGYNDLLLGSMELPEEARKCLAINQRAGKRGARLVRSLLSFSRKAPSEPSVVDLNAEIAEMATLVSSFLPANIELATVLAPNLESVRVDPGGIQQVLLNLVINSRDALPYGGKLEIRTENLVLESASPTVPAGDYVVLAVSDTGVGMDEETKQRLFEPFFTTKPGVGTGLGMHMVQHIVKQSGGFLTVENARENGVQISIYLPRVVKEKLPEHAVARKLPRGGNETILLVEDNADLRHLLQGMLQELGYAVLDAGSADEASQLASGLSGSIDLLVADVMLSDATGVELARQLREARAGMPVLHISGYPEEEVAGQEFLAKPFTMEAFAERVRTMLDRGRRRRVMFVDDDVEVVIFASRILRDAGFEVLVGANGNVALATAQIEPLDLVITDLVMPEREGLETIMRLRKSHPTLPVIAISGAFGGHFLKGATALGASAVLAKPFSGDELLETVRSVFAAE